MKNYKLTFENNRTCTIECEETGQPLQDKINAAEQRFNSPVVKINDKQVKEHSLGGFLLGAVIGSVLGNSVAKSGVKKTASKIGSRTKKAVGKAKKDISEFRKASTKKFSNGGGVDADSDVLSNNEIADNMETGGFENQRVKMKMSSFAKQVRNYPTQVDYNVLENILPDYVSRKDITYVLTKQPKYNVIPKDPVEFPNKKVLSSETAPDGRLIEIISFQPLNDEPENLTYAVLENGIYKGGSDNMYLAYGTAYQVLNKVRQESDDPYYENGGTIKYGDGFSFKKVSKEYAEQNFEKEEIFGINLSQETESLIESKEDLDRFEVFGIEIGYKDKYAEGGLVGKHAIFDRFGEQKMGIITEDLGDGRLIVISGMGQYAVTPDNLISITEPVEKKGFFSFGKGGSVYNRSWHQDHSRHNKAESYEKPMSERSKKFAQGGTVGDFFYDTRKDKTFQVIFEDGDKMGILYMDKSKKPDGKVETISKNEFEYYVQMSAWRKYQQEYGEGGGLPKGKYLVLAELYNLYHKGYSTVQLNGFSESIGYVIGLQLDDTEIKKVGERAYITLYSKGGSTEYNRSWHQDHNRHNKAESYEKPMSERSKKFAKGGMSEHGLRIGDEIIRDYSEFGFNEVQIKDGYGKNHVVSLESGKRSEPFAKGGKITKQPDGTYTHPSGYVIEPAYDKGRYILLDPDGMDAVGESMTLKEAKETLLDNVENYEFGNGGYLVQYGPGNKQTIISTKSEADDFVKTLKEKGHTNIKVRSKSEYKKQYESTSEDIKMDLQKRFNINPNSYALILSEKGKWKISPVNIKDWMNNYGSIQTVEQEINKQYKKFSGGGGVEGDNEIIMTDIYATKNGQKVKVNSQPMELKYAENWIKEQGIDKYYTDIDFKFISKKFSNGGGVPSVKKYRLLSPDGFDIEMDALYSEQELMPAFEQFKKRYEKQGYYSTANRERIDLRDLEDYMTVVEVENYEDYE